MADIKSVRADFRIYDTSWSWGSHISWFDWKTGEVTQRFYGHKPRRPRNGDVLKSEMESGRVAVFVMHDIEYKSDPPDMFFGNASFVGYEDEGIVTVIEEVAEMDSAGVFSRLLSRVRGNDG